jgi:hypothetical protein
VPKHLVEISAGNQRLGWRPAFEALPATNCSCLFTPVAASGSVLTTRVWTSPSLRAASRTIYAAELSAVRSPGAGGPPLASAVGTGRLPRRHVITRGEAEQQGGRPLIPPGPHPPEHDGGGAISATRPTQTAWLPPALRSRAGSQAQWPPRSRAGSSCSLPPVVSGSQRRRAAPSPCPSAGAGSSPRLNGDARVCA